MSRTTRTATYANLIIRFGKDEYLLDYLDNIVLPAFEPGLRRTYGKKTSYFFHDVKIDFVECKEDPSLSTHIVFGSFVKNTYLSIPQQYDNKEGLIEVDSEVQSSPSAFFVVTLRNHKLIYMPETIHAPDLTSFQATLQNFLSATRKRWITDQYLSDPKYGKRKELERSIPQPEVDIVALPSKESIALFVRQFDVIDHIQFQILKPNAEDFRSNVWRQFIEDVVDDLEADSAVLHTKKKDGFDKDKAQHQIRDATSGGNQRVVLQGYDEMGNKIKGDNESIKFTSHLYDVPSERRELASTLTKVFFGLIIAGTLRVDRGRDRYLDHPQVLKSFGDD